MSGGRTTWMGIDVAWMGRELNVRLAMKCGGETWGVLLSLWLAAKQQRSTDGRVKFGYVSLGREAHVDPDRVEVIVAAAVEVGVITSLESDDLGRLVGVLTDFAADDRRGGEALKKADQRAARRPGTEGDTGGQDTGVSHSVPLEEKRGEKKGLADARPGRATARPRRAVDQDQLPVDMPTHLAERVPVVLAKLVSVQAQRGGAVPTTRGVGLAISAFPRRDHLAVAAELEFWALAGYGMRKPTKDWAARYRAFLGNAVDADPVVTGAAAARPRTERDQRNAARLERARAAGLIGGLMSPTDTIEGSVVDAAA